jgi:hypothetical protein
MERQSGVGPDDARIREHKIHQIKVARLHIAESKTRKETVLHDAENQIELNIFL